MAEDSIVTVQRYNVGKRLSDMTLHNGTAYLAGQVADDMTADILNKSLPYWKVTCHTLGLGLCRA